jgi:uncharacterized membrane protein YphA (DoxX/SURF4 family)
MVIPLKLGRFFFAVSLAVFGVQYLLYGRFVGGLLPVPPWTPGAPILAYLTGLALIAASAFIASGWYARQASFFVGFFFLFCVLFLHALHFSDVIHTGVDRTRALEPLALAGAAFVLAGTLSLGPSPSSAHPASGNLAITLGRFLFAFSLVIFGLQHFWYAAFIATLIPSWMPAHLFLAYFTGVAFIAAGLSIAAKILARLSATLLALMFFLWVVFLHAPRVAAHLRNGDELSSLFVALAMSGAALILATSPPHHSSTS